MTQQKTYQSGQKIIAEGTQGSETYQIISGEVHICKEVGKGKRVIIAKLGKGEVFGEMYLFGVSSGFRSASVIAGSEVSVNVITRDEIEAAVQQSPEIVQNILKTLNQRLEETSSAYSQFQAKHRPFSEKLKQLFS